MRSSPEVTSELVHTFPWTTHLAGLFPPNLRIHGDNGAPGLLVPRRPPPIKHASPRSDASARARGNEVFHFRIRCANKADGDVDVAEL
jgi:hypothetical protein